MTTSLFTTISTPSKLRGLDLKAKVQGQARTKAKIKGKTTIEMSKLLRFWFTLTKPIPISKISLTTQVVQMTSRFNLHQLVSLVLILASERGPILAPNLQFVRYQKK